MPFDLTPLWNLAHPHLQPIASPVDNRRVGVVPCPLCHSASAIDIVAEIRLDGRWQRARVHYCRACGKVSLSDEALAEARRNLGVPLSAMPDAVNARLWSTAPTILNLEPTTRCNFSCWYCVGRHMKQEDITLDDFVRVLDNFPTVKAIALVGEGEPLMHTGFFDMARMAAERGIRVFTISNGSTFSSSNVKKMCEVGIAYVSISIDSHRPEQFASSRLDGDLEKVLAGIKRLAEYRDANGYQYPRIGLKGTLFRNTLGEIPEIAKLAKAHGVDIFESFQPLNPMRTYIPIYPKDKLGEIGHIHEVARDIHTGAARATEILKPVQQFCEEEGIVADKNGTPNGLRPNCDEEWIYALQSGDVTPCCQIKEVQSPRWNLARHPIDQILRDADYENARFNLWNGLFPDYCRGCWKSGS